MKFSCGNFTGNRQETGNMNTSSSLRDGLYIVDRGKIYGAFVIRDGEVRQCAPVLRNNIDFYMKIAQYIPTNGEPVGVTAGCEEDFPPPWHAGVE
jgi:hypothetical protein